jgi:hypothetical protein
MKLIGIITMLLLFSSFAEGQRRHRTPTIFDELKKEDSLEGLYINDTLLKVVTDTLPSYSVDENNALRDLKVVYYYYDSLSSVRKVTFRNGREGYYDFYFDGPDLRKARRFEAILQPNVKYYFTAEDNKQTDKEIEINTTQNPEKKSFYDIMKMGKAFLEKSLSRQVSYGGDS